MRLLVLGGTAGLGGAVAAPARDQGHDVTCLTRGSAPVPDGVRLVVADRAGSGVAAGAGPTSSAADPYAAVPGDWDAVHDVSRQPGQVRESGPPVCVPSAFAGSASRRR